MANTYLTRGGITPSNFNKKIFTFSAWFKFAEGGNQSYPVLGFNGSNDYFQIRTSGSDAIDIIGYAGGVTVRKRQGAKLRDQSAYYHIVVSCNSTLSTASDRVKVYLNGVLQTDWGNIVDPSLNYDFINNNMVNLEIGTGIDQLSNRGYFSGIMSHVHYCDGYAYDASDFGETDATTGEWKIKTSPSVTYGTNGFFILKDGNSVTDQSGNSNNFTVGGGTLTNTEDNPSNVFATGNPLYYFNGGHTFSNGNNTMYISGGWRSIISTLGTGTGKYYAEAKFVSVHSGSNNAVAGITELNGTVDEDVAQGLHGNYSTGSTYAYHNDGQLYYNSSNAGAWGSTWTAGDIIGIAVDTENNKLYFHKNGTYQASGNPTAGTGGYSIDANKIYGIGCSGYYNTMSMNYGNGYFGTTAVSSAGTNASGNGIFEYDVPTGYTALSTKGLNL